MRVCQRTSQCLYNTGLGDSFEQFGALLGQVLEDVADGVTITTYTVDDLETASHDPETTLSAQTHIAFDGDIQTRMPVKDGAVDEELWHLHQEMVQVAMGNQNEYLQVLAELGAWLLGSKG